MLDKPSNKRKLHNKDTPTGGGIIFASFGLLTGFIYNLNILYFGFPIAICGFLDDIFKLSFKLRLFIQTIIGIIIIRDLEYLSFETLDSIKILIITILLMSISGIINLTNFMDGIDGLVAGSFIIAFLYLSFNFNLLYLPFTISLLLFALFNWPPAKIFMGDAGSTYLGAVFIGASLHQESILNTIGLLMILSPLFLDSLLTLICRFIFERKNIFKPHKTHLYQRLYISGLKKNYVSLIYISFTLLNALTFKTFGLIGVISSTIFALIIGLYLNKNYAKPLTLVRNYQN